MLVQLPLRPTSDFGNCCDGLVLAIRHVVVARHVVGHHVELAVDIQKCHVLCRLVMETMDLDEPGQWVVPVVDKLVMQWED